MTSERQIRLHFLRAEPINYPLVVEYWSGKCKHRNEWFWLMPVAQVAYRNGMDPRHVAGVVRLMADAFDPAIKCSECGKPKVLTSRADCVTTSYGHYRCDDCETRWRARAIETITKHEDPGPIAQHEPTLAEIGYYDAVLLSAFLTARDTGRKFCPDSVWQDLAHCLMNTKMLLFNPPRPEFKRDVTLDMFTLADVAGRDPTQIRVFVDGVISRRADYPDFADAVVKLWDLVSHGSIVDHFSSQFNGTDLPAFVEDSGIKDVICRGLEIFPIPHIKKVVNHVVDEVAIFSRRKGVDDLRAMKAIEKYLANKITFCSQSAQVPLKPLLGHWESESILTTMFFEKVHGSGLAGFSTLTGTAVRCQSNVRSGPGTGGRE